MMKRAELVFIPSPGIGHLVSSIECAKRLLDRDDRFSITVLLMEPPIGPATHAESLADTHDTRMRFINLPHADPPSLEFPKSDEKFMTDFIDAHIPYVKDAIIKLVLSKSNFSNSVPPAGLVLDVFCTSMIDVAKEFGLPCYLFFTSGAAFIRCMLQLPARHDQVGTGFEETDPDSVMPGYVNPVPSSVLPTVLFNKYGGYPSFLNHARRFRETQGIIVNTYAELETHAANSLLNADDMPPVYMVGPLIDLEGQSQLRSKGSQRDEIMKWLDAQPPCSVVFLCFGSKGCYGEEQVKEIAVGLEQSGQRFLWSLRKPPPKDTIAMPSDYTSDDLQEVLPNGFLKRTRNIGMVCGWVPQQEVLAHNSVGGFVSHCGWNSFLESLWYGVPIVTWPMYAEQQINAFQLVRDLGLAVELRLDFRNTSGEVVLADEIGKAIRSVMDSDNKARKKVKEESEKSRVAVMSVNGSSFAAYGRLIADILRNMHSMKNDCNS